MAAMDEGDSLALTLLLRCVRLERIHGNVALLKEKPSSNLLTPRSSILFCLSTLATAPSLVEKTQLKFHKLLSAHERS